MTNLTSSPSAVSTVANVNVEKMTKAQLLAHIASLSAAAAPTPAPIVDAPAKPAKAKKKKHTIAMDEYPFTANVNEDETADSGWTKSRMANFAKLCLLAKMSQFGPFLKAFAKAKNTAFQSAVADNHGEKFVNAFHELAVLFADADAVKSWADAHLATRKADYAKRIAEIAKDEDAAKLKIDEHKKVLDREYNAFAKLTADALQSFSDNLSGLIRAGTLEASIVHAKNQGSFGKHLIQILNRELGVAVSDTKFAKVMGRLAS